MFNDKLLKAQVYLFEQMLYKPMLQRLYTEKTLFRKPKKFSDEYFEIHNAIWKSKILKAKLNNK